MELYRIYDEVSSEYKTGWLESLAEVHTAQKKLGVTRDFKKLVLHTFEPIITQSKELS